MRTRTWPPRVDQSIADVAVIGGSGFYELAEVVRHVQISTPYGAPSDDIAIARIAGRNVAFIPRHSREHTIPAHRVNYRANLWALHATGARAVIAPCAAGSLAVSIAPGSMVILDNLIDRTHGRADTFFDGEDGVVNHVTFAQPYDAALRALCVDACRAEGVVAHDRGVVVVINGPRFSTAAESKWFAAIGGSVVNMSQYPEAVLAAELQLPYAGIALVTDYDAGIEGIEDRAVTMDQVLAVMRSNVQTFRRVMIRIIASFELRDRAK
jgi:5'-methylthioadenosine phosphorylase